MRLNSRRDRRTDQGYIRVRRGRDEHRLRVQSPGLYRAGAAGEWRLRRAPDRERSPLPPEGSWKMAPIARPEAGLTEHSFSITEKQIWVIKEVKIKEKGNNKKRPSLLKRKNEN